MRKAAKRLPCMLPFGQKYLDNKIQFVHVDDMARLIAWILTREPEAQRLTIIECCRTRRCLEFCAVYRNGACEIAAGAGTMGHAPRSAIIVGLENFGDSSGCRALYDRRSTS